MKQSKSLRIPKINKKTHNIIVLGKASLVTQGIPGQYTELKRPSHRKCW